jgi:hypothetical protein
MNVKIILILNIPDAKPIKLIINLPSPNKLSNLTKDSPIIKKISKNLKKTKKNKPSPTTTPLKMTHSTSNSSSSLSKTKRISNKTSTKTTMTKF